MLLLNSSCGSGITLFFLVGAKKITSKQCLFDKNIVLVFLFDGAVRPHESEPSFSERTLTAACFFFFRPEENRLNALERAKRSPEDRFFPSAFSSDEKIRPRRPGSGR
jgi:hypothetical protein